MKNYKLKLFLFLQTSHFLENNILAKQKVLRLLEILFTGQQNIQEKIFLADCHFDSFLLLNFQKTLKSGQTLLISTSSSVVK